MLFNRKKQAVQMINALTENDAYKMYMKTKELKQDEINRMCERIEQNILTTSQKKKYSLKKTFSTWDVDNRTFKGLLEYSKGIKLYFKEKGYNIRTFIFFSDYFSLTLYVYINWKFK